MSHNLPNFFYQMLCSTEKTAIALTSNVSLADKFQQSHLQFFIKTDVIAKHHSCKKKRNRSHNTLWHQIVDRVSYSIELAANHE